MYCPHCGTENPENFKYCNECGTALIEDDDAESKHTVAYILATTGVLAFLPLGIISGIYLWTRPEPIVKKHGRNIVILCLIILVVFLILWR